jgi:hypothetical protein
VPQRLQGGGAAGGAAAQADFPRVIPWSVDIVSATLGAKTTAVCPTCKPRGRLHGGAECPNRWGRKGIALPGFNLDGTPDPSKWAKVKEPIWATIQAWINLIKDHSQWNNAAPVCAGVPNAPSLADFEKRRLGAPLKL